MATWTVHLRMAQNFLDKLPFLDKAEFVAGSVAPDCGYKKGNNSFSPPPMVTHFSKTGMKNDCNYKDFASKYLLNAKTQKEYSFYLGYYIHLLTDILWSFIIYMPTYDMYGANPISNPDFIKKIKADWSLMDIKYFCENSDFAAFEILKSIDSIEDYLDFYKKGQLMYQLREIIDFYNSQKEKVITKNPRYISAKKVDSFIQSAYDTICVDLKNKGFDKPHI